MKTLHEKMKDAFSGLSALAGAYLPKGFKDALLDMARKSDLQEQEITAMKVQLEHLTGIINHSN
jgi:hypothetical protein